jgi:hypothetical protein
MPGNAIRGISEKVPQIEIKGIYENCLKIKLQALFKVPAMNLQAIFKVPSMNLQAIFKAPAKIIAAVLKVPVNMPAVCLKCQQLLFPT